MNGCKTPRRPARAAGWHRNRIRRPAGRVALAAPEPMIDFESSESHLLLNPRMPREERERLERIAGAVSLPGHVFVATSGSTGAIKLVALSKGAL